MLEVREYDGRPLVERTRCDVLRFLPDNRGLWAAGVTSGMKKLDAVGVVLID